MYLYLGNERRFRLVAIVITIILLYFTMFYDKFSKLTYDYLKKILWTHELTTGLKIILR